MLSPILLGRIVPTGGLAVDFGRMIDYLWMSNKDIKNALLVSFTAIPVSTADTYYIRPNGGLDVGGLNIRYVYLRSEADFIAPPAPDMEVDLIGVNMVLGSLDESRGGSARAATPYPFSIQSTESIANRRRSQSLIPRRGLYCDWITNSMGGDAGKDSPQSY